MARTRTTHQRTPRESISPDLEAVEGSKEVAEEAAEEAAAEVWPAVEAAL